MALELPKHTRIDGVRLCYELNTGSTSYIDDIRLAQIQNPPSSALVLLETPLRRVRSARVCQFHGCLISTSNRFGWRFVAFGSQDQFGGELLDR